MMLTVLLLAGAEKLINMAIGSDEITKAGLSPLTGKVLRLNMAMPELQVDILFNHAHVRFEPVTTNHLFEAQAQTNDERIRASKDRVRLGHSLPDCTLNVENFAQVLNLMRSAEGNLPIAGDYKVLMQIKQLVAGFDPDIAGQLEPIIGKPLASQLQLLISQLKRSFGENAKAIQISAGVFSDFAPHVSLIRSFSVGENFPPQYPHFAAGDIPYHFLFHFLVSSLESLGLPLSWSFNLPSIISLLSLLLLVYVFAMRITNMKMVGILALVFIFFRASWAFFQFAQSYELSQLPQAILEIDFYAGKTPNAGWGMWTMFNTFANQRHLSFGLCASFIALILMLPLVEANLFKIAEDKSSQKWRIECIQRAIFVGVFLGSIAFWNGATLMAALMVLAGFALTSRHRFEYVLIAVIAVVLATIQSRWFINPGKSPLNASIVFGFLAEKKTIWGVASYILQAYGVLLPLFLLSVFYWRKYAAIAFAISLPFIFAFTVQPTIDMALNHKFVLFSLFLMGIFVAWMLVDVWCNKKKVWRLAVVPALFFMTITGSIDTAAFQNINSNKYGIPKDNPVTAWVIANTPPQSIFLTELVTINPVLFGGRLSYLGWPYYGWGAGYDTSGRENDIRMIYGAGTKEDLLKALENRPIDYILVNDAVRQSTNYVINENLIADTFPRIFESPYEGTNIYKVAR